MPLIVLDGPEKAGKSTLAQELVRQHNAVYVHWGPVKDHSRYVEALERDVALAEHRLVVWDRCWASETVYGPLLNRKQRDESDPWLMEWLYGRAANTVGTRAIVLPINRDRLAVLRDDTDLPVDPIAEYEKYMAYGRRFGWQIMWNTYEEVSVRRNADLLASAAYAQYKKVTIAPPHYAGPPDPDVLVVGEDGNPDNPSKPRGCWIPFTSRYTTRLGRAMGDNALRCGWTNFPHVIPSVLRSPRTVLACGDRVYSRLLAMDVLGPHQRLVKIQHPSWMYRWPMNTPLVAGYEQQAHALVKDALSQAA
jgi:hypothetical protein